MMTEYCMQCGKVLTTGDDRFQCFSCWYKNNRQEDEDSDLQKIRCDEIKATIAQKDAEIERLREALKRILDIKPSNSPSMAARIYDMKEIAKQALKEVNNE